MADRNVEATNGITLWKTIVTILATITVSLFLQLLSIGYSTPSRAEMNAAVQDAKTEAKRAAEDIGTKLDEMQKKLEQVSIKLEHVNTLLEKEHR